MNGEKARSVLANSLLFRFSSPEARTSFKKPLPLQFMFLKSKIVLQDLPSLKFISFKARSRFRTPLVPRNLPLAENINESKLPNTTPINIGLFKKDTIRGYFHKAKSPAK